MNCADRVRYGKACWHSQGSGTRHGPGRRSVRWGSTLTVEDDRQDDGEDHYITIGFLDATMVVRV